MKLGELIDELGGKLVAGDQMQLVNGVNSVERGRAEGWVRRILSAREVRS